MCGVLESGDSLLGCHEQNVRGIRTLNPYTNPWCGKSPPPKKNNYRCFIPLKEQAEYTLAPLKSHPGPPSVQNSCDFGVCDLKGLEWRTSQE